MFSMELKRTSPFAPDYLNGEYKLVISGRHMKLTSVDDGKKVRATCNKTDNWNMMDGIEQCLKRMDAKKKDEPIKVGTVVEVVKVGRAICQGDNYFRKYDLAKYAVKYAYGTLPPKNVRFRVMDIIDNIAVIQPVGDVRYSYNADANPTDIKVYGDLTSKDVVFLVHVSGLKRVD